MIDELRMRRPLRQIGGMFEPRHSSWERLPALAMLPAEMMPVSRGEIEVPHENEPMKPQLGEETYRPLVERGFEVHRFEVSVEDRGVTAMIASPSQHRLDPDPLLLLSIGDPATHFVPPNHQPAEYFWQRGHRVVSFAIPVADSLDALRDRFLSGPDPFETFVRDAQAVLRYCMEQGWARPGRIVVTGISRYAYLAFRLMAADEGLNVGGGFAPVTDWRDLSEFHAVRDRKDIADLSLSCFVAKLAGKHIYMCIGGHDERVNTRRCAQFFIDLNAANHKRGMDGSYVDFHITLDPTHTCGEASQKQGLAILMERALAVGRRKGAA